MSQMSTHEFSFANAISIHRVGPWLFPADQPQYFRRLNEADLGLKFDPFFGWRLRVCAARLG
jgi:hypothetical protein